MAIVRFLCDDHCRSSIIMTHGPQADKVSHLMSISNYHCFVKFTVNILKGVIYDFVVLVGQPYIVLLLGEGLGMTFLSSLAHFFARWSSILTPIGEGVNMSGMLQPSTLSSWSHWPRLPSRSLPFEWVPGDDSLQPSSGGLSVIIIQFSFGVLRCVLHLAVVRISVDMLFLVIFVSRHGVMFMSVSASILMHAGICAATWACVFCIFQCNTSTIKS